MGMSQRKPVSRWISVPLSLLLLPILLFSAVGAASLLFDNPEEYAVIRPVVGVVLLILIVVLGTVVVRIILGKKSPGGSLFPPAILRVFAVLFLILPIGGLFTNWYVDYPLSGTIQAVTYIAISATLWRLARSRSEKLQRQLEQTKH